MPPANEEKKFADLFNPGDPEIRRAALAEAEAGEPSPGHKPAAELDLHGLTLAEAEIKIKAFIQRCHAGGFGRARIITGRGRHSPGGPVLKTGAERFLRNLKKQGLVAAITWEGRKKKSGALLVRLR